MAVTNLDDWLTSDETNSLAFTVSAGSDRYLIGVVNHEGTSGAGGATGATWNGATMTLIQDAFAFGNFNASQIWILDEADIAATDLSGNFVTTGTVGDTPSLAMACFAGVDQIAPHKDGGVWEASGVDGRVENLTIDDDDMIIGTFCSTGGVGVTAWVEEIATPDSTFAVNTDDDPSEGAYKAHSAGDTTTGIVKATGGTSNRIAICAIILAAAAAGDPVLTADSGAYVLTGTAASLERGRFLDIGSGAYVFTGTAASLERGRFLDIGSGAYVFSGTAASLERGRFLDIGSGAYVFTGTAATLTHDTGADPILTADPGAYVLTGTNASLEFGRAIDADSGAYVLTGAAASLERGRFLDIGSGAYVLSGKDASLLFDRILNPESGAYLLTGSDVSLISSADVREFLVLTTTITREDVLTNTITRTDVLANTITREKILSTKILQ